MLQPLNDGKGLIDNEMFPSPVDIDNGPNAAGIVFLDRVKLFLYFFAHVKNLL